MQQCGCVMTRFVDVGFFCDLCRVVLPFWVTVKGLIVSFSKGGRRPVVSNGPADETMK